MISAGIEGRIPPSYMTYSEPWGGSPRQHPEFLRPAPKPIPPISRFNGVSINTSPNGTRMVPAASPQRSPGKYSSPPSTSTATITQQPKENVSVEDFTTYAAYTRLLAGHPPPPPPHHFAFHNSGPYATLYQPPFTPLIRQPYAPPPLSPLEPPYTPNTPTSINSSVTFLTPPSPSTTLSNSEVLQHSTPSRNENKKPSVNFKVPTGKEGSLKHRILTRPGESNVHSKVSLDLPRVPECSIISENVRRIFSGSRLSPKSPAKSTINSNNVISCDIFKKGAVIQLANGEYKKLEDMRTEDFVNSVRQTPGLTLAHTTVVKLDENPILHTVTVTLTYHQRKMTYDFEYPLDYPFFVYGHGWASCMPDRTLQNYGLKADQLRVGDIVISLIPCESNKSSAAASSTTTSTVTTTAVTTRVTPALCNQQSSYDTSMQSYQVIMNNSSSVESRHYHAAANSQQMGANNIKSSGVSQQNFLQPQPISPESTSSKKRRWSAPEQICDVDEQSCKRVK